MNVDTKHPLMQNFLGASVASPEQKSLDLGLKNENEKNPNQKKKKDSGESISDVPLKAKMEKEKAAQEFNDKKIIERDPMKLLGVF